MGHILIAIADFLMDETSGYENNGNGRGAFSLGLYLGLRYPEYAQVIMANMPAEFMQRAEPLAQGIMMDFPVTEVKL